jgi:hypothetical protein
MEPESLLLWSQEPASGFYAEPDESSPQPHALFLLDPLQALTSVSSGFQTKVLHVYLIVAMRATFPGHRHPNIGEDYE